MPVLILSLLYSQHLSEDKQFKQSMKYKVFAAENKSSSSSVVEEDLSDPRKEVLINKHWFDYPVMCVCVIVSTDIKDIV